MTTVSQLFLKPAPSLKLKLPPMKDVQELLHQANIEKEFYDKAPVLVRDGFVSQFC